MPSPDFQLTPSGLEGMDGGKADREKGGRKMGEREEIKEREGLSMTPALKVWVSIALASSHCVGDENRGNPLRHMGEVFKKMFNTFWRIHSETNTGTGNLKVGRFWETVTISQNRQFSL